MGPPGLEPGTSSLSATRSSQLSYEPQSPPTIKTKQKTTSPKVNEAAHDTPQRPTVNVSKTTSNHSDQSAPTPNQSSPSQTISTPPPHKQQPNVRYHSSSPTPQVCHQHHTTNHNDTSTPSLIHAPDHRLRNTPNAPNHRLPHAPVNGKFSNYPNCPNIFFNPFCANAK